MGASEPSPSPDLTAQDSSTRKTDTVSSVCKNQGRLGWQKKLLDFHCLKGLNSLRMYANPPILRFTIREAAGRG